MTRKKVKLAYITSDSARKATFKKRKKGLVKKVCELTTLCGIEACAIIYSPYDAQPEVWPSPMGVQHVLSQFKNMPEMEQNKKMVNQESFIRQRIGKGNEQLKKQRKDNREKEVTKVMFQCLTGRTLTNLNMMDLNDLGWIIDDHLKGIYKHVDTINKELNSQVTTIVPPPPPPPPLPQVGFLPPLPQVGLQQPLPQEGFLPPLPQEGFLPPLPQAGLLPQAGSILQTLPPLLPPLSQSGLILPPLPQAGPILPPLPQIGSMLSPLPPLQTGPILPPLPQAGSILSPLPPPQTGPILLPPPLTSSLVGPIGEVTPPQQGGDRQAFEANLETVERQQWIMDNMINPNENLGFVGDDVMPFTNNSPNSLWSSAYFP